MKKLTKEQEAIGIQDIECENCYIVCRIQAINKVNEPFLCSIKCQREWKEKN